MKRRDFLRKAGIVGLGLVAAPAIVSALPKPKPKPKPYLVDPALFPNLELVNNEVDNSMVTWGAPKPGIKKFYHADEMNKGFVKRMEGAEDARAELERRFAEDLNRFYGKYK